MAQGLPPAEYASSGRGGYSFVAGAASAFQSGVEFGAGDGNQTYTTSGSDGDTTQVDEDTVYLGVDTSSNSKTGVVELDNAEQNGRMLAVYDSGGAAGTDGIDIQNSSDTTVHNITTNNELVMLWYVDGTWVKDVWSGSH